MTPQSTKPIEFVDAHCHVDLFPDPIAIARGVEEKRIHTIAVTNAPSVFEHTERLARGSVYLHPAVGLHPELVATHGAEVGKLVTLIPRTRFIGEIGLDYTTNDKELRLRQRAVFSKALEECAGARDKIITVHSRRAAADTIAAIGDRYPGRIILHWFSGSQRELERAIQFGFYFSINPAMISSTRGLELIRAMPRERILTESDGPFVTTKQGVATPQSSPATLAFLANSWRTSVNEAALTVVSNLFDPPSAKSQ